MTSISTNYRFHNGWTLFYLRRFNPCYFTPRYDTSNASENTGRNYKMCSLNGYFQSLCQIKETAIVYHRYLLSIHDLIWVKGRINVSMCFFSNQANTQGTVNLFFCRWMYHSKVYPHISRINRGGHCHQMSYCEARYYLL